MSVGFLGLGLALKARYDGKSHVMNEWFMLQTTGVKVSLIYKDMRLYPLDWVTLDTTYSILRHQKDPEKTLIIPVGTVQDGPRT
jgi:hypothetical protein